MKIVVAGGTGFLGRHISRALIDAGHDIVVLSRDPGKVTRVPQLAGAAGVRGDVTDAGSLLGAVDGAEAVVVAVQFPNYPMELPRKGLTFHRYDFQGTRNLLAEARRAGVGRFVYISGAAVDATSDKPWYRAKGMAEDAIKASGIDYAILRPSWAYGPEDKALNKFASIARRSPIVPQPVPGPRLARAGRFVVGGLLVWEPQRVQPVYVGDIALAVRRMFEVDDAWGETFEIGSPDVMTMRQVIDTLCAVMGVRRVIVPVPVQLIQLATAPLVALPRPPLTPAGAEFAVQDGLVDVSKIERVLDVHPVALHEGLARYLQR